MRVLLWHVHGSWTTSFVSGDHDYLLPVSPDRGPDGRGRATSWNWPSRAREVPLDQLVHELPDVVVLQRPHEADLLQRLTGLRVGRDLPAVYLEHNAPTGHAVTSRHPVTERPELSGIPVVHVTWFNSMAWDCGEAETMVVEHGIPDPGHLYTGTDPSLAVVVNEPVRRWRVAGTDVVLDLMRDVPVHVYGIQSEALRGPAGERGLDLDDRVHDLPQHQLHRQMARHYAYLHPYRWTSLGLSLLEAMTIGMPVLALATTEAPAAVPASAGLVSNDIGALRRQAAAWLAHPDQAAACGRAAREHALTHYGLSRFLDDWDRILKEVAQ